AGTVRGAGRRERLRRGNGATASRIAGAAAWRVAQRGARSIFRNRIATSPFPACRLHQAESFEGRANGVHTDRGSPTPGRRLRRRSATEYATSCPKYDACRPTDERFTYGHSKEGLLSYLQCPKERATSTRNRRCCRARST